MTTILEALTASHHDLAVVLGPEHFADIDVRDAEVLGSLAQSDTIERITIGFGDRAVIVAGHNLLTLVDETRKVLDRVEESVMDARQHKAEQEARRCWCGTLLFDPDDTDCGATRCVRLTEQDLQGRIR